MLAYLSRDTHRVAISNRRLVSADASTLAFRLKDYRVKHGEPPQTGQAQDDGPSNCVTVDQDLHIQKKSKR